LSLMSDYQNQLRRTVVLQKETIDGLNKIIVLQQRQLDQILYTVHHRLGLLDENESGRDEGE
jgi:hypothetical protein